VRVEGRIAMVMRESFHRFFRLARSSAPSRHRVVLDAVMLLLEHLAAVLRSDW
jgi:hypothetical protein